MFFGIFETFCFTKLYNFFIAWLSAFDNFVHFAFANDVVNFTTGEIKFRGRRLDNGKWVTGDLLHSKNGKVLINAGTKMFTTYAEVDPNTVGQFTGHRDKKGREIYEGDILRREWCYRSDPEYDDRGEITGYNYERTGHIIAPVAFAPCAGFHTKGGYSVMHKPGADEPSLLACTINKLKATKSVIIGNIYDHPELTKAPKQ